jgi:hypothetical protein
MRAFSFLAAGTLLLVSIVAVRGSTRDIVNNDATKQSSNSYDLNTDPCNMWRAAGVQIINSRNNVSSVTNFWKLSRIDVWNKHSEATTRKDFNVLLMTVRDTPSDWESYCIYICIPVQQRDAYIERRRSARVSNFKFKIYSAIRWSNPCYSDINNSDPRPLVVFHNSYLPTYAKGKKNCRESENAVDNYTPVLGLQSFSGLPWDDEYIPHRRVYAIPLFLFGSLLFFMASFVSSASLSTKNYPLFY